MDAQEMKLNCLHLAANLLGANSSALAGENKKPTPEEVTEAAGKLYSWIKE